MQLHIKLVEGIRQIEGRSWLEETDILYLRLPCRESGELGIANRQLS
ncbi:hypothetical protein [Microcoleus sp. B9-D4]